MEELKNILYVETVDVCMKLHIGMQLLLVFVQDGAWLRWYVVLVCFVNVSKRADCDRYAHFGEFGSFG